jgi:hypothetical protein
MIVIPERTCAGGHDCDILEVVDIHTSATSQDKGFDELRAHARAIGSTSG